MSEVDMSEFGLDASELRSGEYGWELRHSVIPNGETPERRLRIAPSDVVLLKTCRVGRDCVAAETEADAEAEIATEAGLSWTINWVPIPLSSTILQSDEASTRFFNVVLTFLGILPTPTDNRGRMISDIISLAHSITGINGSDSDHHEFRPSYVSGMEFPVIEARIWDADDAEAKEEVASRRSVEFRDDLPEYWYATCPIVIDRLNRLEKVMFWESSEEECSICLQGYGVEQEIVRIPCSHVFHFHCIVHWLHNSNSCPLCRTPT